MTSVAIAFTIAKATPEGRFVSGWLSVVQKDGKRVTDAQDDLISMAELRKGVHKYMSGSRVIKKQHSGDQIGEMREIVMIDDDFAKAHGITHTKRGAWGTAEITDAATREDVKKGKVTGWSMGGRGKRTPVEKAGKARPPVKRKTRGLLKLGDYKLAMAAGQDAANRSMRRAGRSAWSVQDRDHAISVFNRIYRPVNKSASALYEAVEKAGFRGGSAQTYYRMRRGADRAASQARRDGVKSDKPGRYVRAGRYLLRRINRAGG